MSTLSNLIFKNAEHWVSSPFGYRGSISTSAGATSTFHSGVDYATNRKKLPQYAIEDGEVLSCGRDWAYGGAKYVWVSYPRLGVKMLHYHLDSINVKAGQAVNKNTVLGTTGMTGRATGIHLHLGMKRLSGGGWIDPEKWSKEEYTAPKKKKYGKGTYKVTKADVLNVRKGPSTKYGIVKYSKMTSDAQAKIKKLAGKKVNGYVRGLTFSVLEVAGEWGRTPSGWVCLKYCERIDT